MLTTADLIAQFQRDAQRAVSMQHALWVITYLEENTGFVRRAQELIDMIKSKHGRTYLYILPDDRTWDNVRRLFNYKGEPGSSARLGLG